MFPCTCLDLSKNIGSADQIIGVKRKVAITDEYIGVPGGIIGGTCPGPPSLRLYSCVFVDPWCMELDWATTFLYV